MKPWERLALPTAVGVLLIVIWATAVRVSGTTVFPLPESVLLGARELAAKGLLAT